jgi:hypothetical protein
MLLLDFQVQVLKWTSDSGSNSEQNLWQKIPFGQLIRKRDFWLKNKHSLGRQRDEVSAAMAFKSKTLGRTSIQCQVEWSFAVQCSLVKPETLIILRT